MTQFDQRSQQVGTQYNAGRDIHLYQPLLTLTEQQRKHNRAAMLKLVHSIWIEGVLEPSLHGAAQIALELQHKPSAVITPWWVVLREFQQTGPLMPSDMSILQVYDQANGELLILGEPGSGKTTLLLQLARDLLEQARQNESHPLPVIFTLSSWATKRLPLSEWLAEELNVKYQIPLPLAASWIATDQVLPLLDGLDEVEATHQAACVEVINAYRQAHGLLPTVVCSRQADYFALPTRTLLRTAVVVQPLTPEQIEIYLTSAGEPLMALRQALQEDIDLQTLAGTPLMLTILTLAYRGTSLDEIAPLGTLPAKRQQIFSTYIKRMLTRRGSLKAGTDLQVEQWLTFLASQMRAHNQAIFYLEQLQPDWLAPVQQRSYVWLAVRLPAILIGILAGLVIVLVLPVSADPLQSATLGGLLGWIFSESALAKGSLPQQTGGHHHKGRIHLLGGRVALSVMVGLIVGPNFELGSGNYQQYEGFIAGVVFALSSLLLSWLLPPLFSEYAFAFKANRTQRRWKSLVNLIQTVHGQCALLVIAIVGGGYGLSEGLLSGLSEGLFPGLTLGLSGGLPLGLSAGLISVLVSLILEVQSEAISLTERLRWTWSSLIRSLLMPKHMRTALLIASVVGVTIGLSNWIFFLLSEFGLRTGLSIGPSAGLSAGLTYWLLLGLFQGISREQVEDRSRLIPNQGIRHSLHNGLLMALISGGIIGVVGSLGNGLSGVLRSELFYGLSGGLNYGLSGGLNYGLSAVLAYGLSAWLAGLCGALLVCSMSGGLAALRHGILRLLLRRSGVVPRLYVRFLDEAASCILLRKVGGGYSFVHRLLLDHFADLEQHGHS